MDKHFKDITIFQLMHEHEYEHEQECQNKEPGTCLSISMEFETKRILDAHLKT